VAALTANRFLAALRDPDPTVRLWLVCGRDEGEAETLAAAARAALAKGAEEVEIAPSTLADDPAVLADRAAAIPLFGTRELLFVRAHVHPRPDTLLSAVEALLAAPAAGNPCLVHAGDLSKTSKLRVLAETHRLARATVAWAPREEEVEGMLRAAARAHGVLLDSAGAARLWQAAGANRRIAERELEKLALFLDAAPDRPKPATRHALDVLLPGDLEAEVGSLARAIAGRDGAATASALLGLEGTSAIPAIRAVARQLLDARGAAGRWRPAELAAAVDALIDAEAAVKAPRSAGDRLGWAALLRLALPPLGGRPPNP
jgi:DNA polymerase-3 subunit delta